MFDQRDAGPTSRPVPSTPGHRAAETVSSGPSGRVAETVSRGSSRRAPRPDSRTRRDATGDTGPVSLDEIREFLTRIADVDPDLDDRVQIDQIAALEQVKSACAAAQAKLTTRVHATQAARDQVRGIDAGKTARSVGSQVALARGDSPHRGNRHLGLALALTSEMPHTLAALTGGRISEWAATLLVRATACLSAGDRGRVDEELSPRLGSLSDRRLDAAARAAAARLDPASVTARRRRAEADRRVTLRPAPDTMTHLTALLPVKDGVACYAALKAAADTARAGGDPRSRGQVMAAPPQAGGTPSLTARVTGRDPAVGPDIEIGLVMPVDTFFGHGGSPGFVPGYGPIPADLAHQWAHDAPTHPDAGPEADGDHRTTGGAGAPAGSTFAPGPSGSTAAAQGTTASKPPARANASAATGDGDPADSPGRKRAERFIRRLFSTPDQQHLVAMESTRRHYDGLLAKFLVIRDQTCRMPGCDAPIRHLDHIRRHTDDGATTAANGQGLCEGCNYLKEHPDWHVTAGRAGPNEPPDSTTTGELGPDRDTGAWHQTTWTTPTGHTYTSDPPPPRGA